MVKFFGIVGLALGLSLFLGPIPLIVVAAAYLIKWIIKK